jgi:hypothetical protein
MRLDFSLTSNPESNADLDAVSNIDSRAPCHPNPITTIEKHSMQSTTTNESHRRMGHPTATAFPEEMA